MEKDLHDEFEEIMKPTTEVILLQIDLMSVKEIKKFKKFLKNTFSKRYRYWVCDEYTNAQIQK